MGSIALNLEEIEEIDVGKCISITDEGVMTISMRCNQLVSFDGSSCIELSDDSIMYLATNCKSIEFLAFEYCYKLTNKCVKYVELCKNLEHLDLNGCSKISYEWWLLPSPKEKQHI